MSKNIDLGKVVGNTATINGKTNLTINAQDGISTEITGTILNIKSSLKKNDLKLESKVDKVDGKQLSEEDFTTELKNKLDSVSNNATRVIVEEQFSETSENTLQNKVVKKSFTAIEEKINLTTTIPVGSVNKVLGFNSDNQLAPIDLRFSNDFTMNNMVIEGQIREGQLVGDKLDLSAVNLFVLYNNGMKLKIEDFTVSPEYINQVNDQYVITYNDGYTFVSKRISYEATKRILRVPVQKGDILFDGETHTPEWDFFDERFMTMEGTTSSTNIGTHTVTVTLKNPENTRWFDNVTEVSRTTTWEISKLEHYGFELITNESDPSNKIRYLQDNALFRSAKMNYGENRFDYGDWKNAWFIKKIKPVIMNVDGTIYQELDPNDYTKYSDGNHRVESEEFHWNLDTHTMVGIPTVWIKVDNESTNPKFYFSNIQLDSSYHAYAHTNVVGRIIPYTYFSVYDTSEWHKYGGIRSLHGKMPATDSSYVSSLSNARNSDRDKPVWDITSFSDRMLITLLLILIGKSTDTQTVFGKGNVNGIEAANSENYDENGRIESGFLDRVGLFFGFNDPTKPVKVFGIENFWGNTNKFVNGLISEAGIIKYKLYRTTPSDFNIFLDYIDSGITFTGRGYIVQMKAVECGLLPLVITGGSSTTYFCDHAAGTTHSDTNIAIMGSDSNSGDEGGLFRIITTNNIFEDIQHTSAPISYKPL